MRDGKPLRNLITFKRALDIIKSTNQLDSDWPNSVKDELDPFLIYQNYREIMKSLARFEEQKAVITERLRRQFF